ncbi:MAG: DUF1127 domain-containing protein [Enhydrobacter sp.]|nr:DUF1127 domain-containing protein [Enhydrobacter sp.]
MQVDLLVYVSAGEPGRWRPGHRVLLVLALWHHRFRSRRHLAALEDRQLDDIGLSRAQCRAECRKHFWQA